MNRLATETNRKAKRMPAVVARLDLEDADQHRLHGLIQRMHSGRWPLFRLLGMRQIAGVLYEAVEWLRMAKPQFGLVTWRSDGLGMSWKDADSADEARAMLKALK
ncbi:MAG: hypothetical protein JNJ46_15245 [Myxococcales bacterium]|nr:hypothetical protein [Myxococcales bacterium]